MEATAEKLMLIIEDDSQMLDLLRDACQGLGFDIGTAADGRSGLEKALSRQYALIICDINLPKLNGFELCREFRKQNEVTPFLMLTSRGDEVDKVLGLNIGADDYLTKPFSVNELLARVHALLRRSAAYVKTGKAPLEGKRGVMQFGRLAIDRSQYKISYAGSEIPLTPLEFEIVCFLAESPSQVFSREQLMREVWGYDAGDFRETITTQLGRLRRKLEMVKECPKLIETVRGVGYRFRPPDDGR